MSDEINRIGRDVHTLSHRVTKLEEWPPRVMNVEQAIATLGSEYKALRETVEQSNQSAKETRRSLDQLKDESARGFSGIRGALYMAVVAIPTLMGVIAGAYKIIT